MSTLTEAHIACDVCGITPEDPAASLTNHLKSTDHWLCTDIKACVERAMVRQRAASAADLDRARQMEAMAVRRAREAGGEPEQAGSLDDTHSDDEALS
jgi:hypothetical protein